MAARSHSRRSGSTTNRSSLDRSSKRIRTKEVYQNSYDHYVFSRWGNYQLAQIRAVDLEKWLGELELAPNTKRKHKGLLSVRFQHAIRHDWASHNPIRAVHQIREQVREIENFTTSEIAALLNELDDPAFTVTKLAVGTGLRRGKLFGLKWGDVNFEQL